MIGIPRSLRVALAGTAAVATIAAGATALVATSASAAVVDATTLQIEPLYPSDNSASAGTCMIYRVVPKTGFGAVAGDSGTVVITLKENPNSGTQDVDFCLPPTPAQRPSSAAGAESGTAAVVDHGYYTNSPQPATPTAGSRQYYCAGESITPGSVPPPTCAKPTNAGSGSAHNPDVSSKDSLTDNLAVDTNTNPSGTDYIDDVRYNHDTSQGAVADFIEFGVAGLTPGAATIDACIDRNNNGNCSSSGSVPDVQAGQVALTFTAGGPPDGIAAYDAVTNVTPDRTSYTAVQNPPTPASIDLTLLNSNADSMFGVIPNFRVNSGPNADGTIRGCTRSTDFGRSNCQYQGTNVGTDTLLFWVNHSAPPNGTATAGPDPGEPTATVTVTTYAQAAPAASARFIDLTPNTPTSTTAGQSKVFTAFVTDTSGVPVQGAQVTFSETGPGRISGGSSPDGVTSSLTQFTGPDGRTSVTVTTQPGESGDQTVTATLSGPSQCGNVFNGQTGTCSDSTVNRIGGGPSPSPRPSTSASTTPSPSASASPTTSPARRQLFLSTSTTDIQPNQAGILDARGEPNASVELRCYSRPNTAYFTARGPLNLSGSGTTQFRITPGTNTRCYVRYGTDEATASDSVVVNVHTTLSLSAYRDGVRKYHFQGTNLPRRAGQLITLYRYARRDNNGYCDPQIAPGDYTATSSDPNCMAVRTAIAYTNSSNVWRIDRSFTGSGQFVFQVRTSQTMTNGAGISNSRLTIIH